VRIAAASDVHVLLVGETGTGKELAARAIHRLSRRRASAFVPHNCATTSAELFDSEFFGHRRGAFTGADREHVGLLVHASEGVLFLDELASMGTLQQAKLLRVLDDGVVRPVGGAQSQRVNVRFIAATNRDSAVLLQDGSLREDLYYRLLGFEIVMPPLRRRLEDVPALAEHFLGSEAERLTSGARDALVHAEWPGNVRQLSKVLAFARALAGTGPIEARHLGGLVSNRGAVASEAAGRSMKDLLRDGIARAVQEAGGNRSRAARALGIDRSTLRRKLKGSDPF
jgi:DNA-binding NtrC family response regulator